MLTLHWALGSNDYILMQHSTFLTWFAFIHFHQSVPQSEPRPLTFNTFIHLEISPILFFYIWTLREKLDVERIITQFLGQYNTVSKERERVTFLVRCVFPIIKI